MVVGIGVGGDVSELWDVLSVCKDQRVRRSRIVAINSQFEL